MERLAPAHLLSVPLEVIWPTNHYCVMYEQDACAFAELQPKSIDLKIRSETGHYWLYIFALQIYKLQIVQAVSGDGLILSLSAAYISDLIKPSNRATALSLNLAGTGLAFVVGPIVGGRLPSRVTVWLSSGSSILAIILVAGTIPESVSQAGKSQVYLFREGQLFNMYFTLSCIKAAEIRWVHLRETLRKKDAILVRYGCSKFCFSLKCETIVLHNWLRLRLGLAGHLHFAVATLSTLKNLSALSIFVLFHASRILMLMNLIFDFAFTWSLPSTINAAMKTLGRHAMIVASHIVWALHGSRSHDHAIRIYV